MPINSSELPVELAKQAELAWSNILEAADDSVGPALECELAEAAYAGQCARVLACSAFVADVTRRKPALLLELLRSGELQDSLSSDSWQRELAARLGEPDAELGVVLRQFRQRHMVRIIWRDFCRLADTLETVRDTSLLAEACIAAAQTHCHAALEARHGAPVGAQSGEPQQLIVIAMGKLGAGELNVSSDIDLVFAYPEAGQTDGAQRRIFVEHERLRLRPLERRKGRRQGDAVQIRRRLLSGLLRPGPASHDETRGRPDGRQRKTTQ